MSRKHRVERSPRFAQGLVVRLGLELPPLVAGRTLNISASGLAVESRLHQRVGRTLFVELLLPGYGSCRLVTQVVWAQRGFPLLGRLHRLGLQVMQADDSWPTALRQLEELGRIDAPRTLRRTMASRPAEPRSTRMEPARGEPIGDEQIRDEPQPLLAPTPPMPSMDATVALPQEPVTVETTAPDKRRMDGPGDEPTPDLRRMDPLPTAASMHESRLSSRRETRASAAVPMRYGTQGLLPFRGTVLNVSQGGFGFRGDHPLAEGSRLFFAVELEGGVVVRGEAEVVRRRSIGPGHHELGARLVGVDEAWGRVVALLQADDPSISESDGSLE